MSHRLAHRSVWFGVNPVYRGPLLGLGLRCWKATGGGQGLREGGGATGPAGLQGRSRPGGKCYLVGKTLLTHSREAGGAGDDFVSLTQRGDRRWLSCSVVPSGPGFGSPCAAVSGELPWAFMLSLLLRAPSGCRCSRVTATTTEQEAAGGPGSKPGFCLAGVFMGSGRGFPSVRHGQEGSAKVRPSRAHPLRTRRTALGRQLTVPGPHPLGKS